MRFALFLALSLSAVGVGRAQSPTLLQTAADSRQEQLHVLADSRVIEQRAERIHVEDAGSSIDELRVGGQTRSIRVQPKGGMPAYEVEPVSGERSWKFLSF
ncbi:MAG: hypothetical protein ACOYNZ_16040 [Rhodoferax sp.]